MRDCKKPYIGGVIPGTKFSHGSHPWVSLFFGGGFLCHNNEGGFSFHSGICEPLLLMAEIRQSPVDMVNICKYSIIYEGFIRPWWRRISSINST